MHVTMQMMSSMREREIYIYNIIQRERANSQAGQRKKSSITRKWKQKNRMQNGNENTYGTYNGMELDS